MISTAMLFLLPLLFANAPAQSITATDLGVDAMQDDSVLMRYDLGSVLPSFDDESGWKHSLNRGFENIWSNERSTLNVAESYQRSAPEAITELIKQILGDELYAEGRMVSLEGGSSLLVLAPAAIQKRVAAATLALAQGFSSAVGVRIDVVELKGALGDDTPSLLQAGAVDRYLQSLLARNGTRHSYTLDLTAGRTGVIDQRTSRAMVVDYDIGIAKGSLVYDPTSLKVEEGEMFLLQAVPFPSGSALSVIMTSNQMVGDIKEYELSMPNYVGHEESGRMAMYKGPGMLQSGQLQMRSVAASAFLESGQALVFASQANQGGTEVSRVIVIRQTSANVAGYKRVDFPGSDMSLMLVNAAVFDSSPLSFEHDRSYSGDQFWTPGLKALVNTNHSDFLFEWTERHFSVWRRVGPWVAIVSRPEWDGKSAADLERLFKMVEPVREQVSVDLEFGSNSAGHAPMRWSLPMLLGAPAAVLLGTSTTAIVDLDVEVASDANAKDPLVAAQFHGIAAELGISGTGEQRTLGVRGSGHWNDMPATFFDLGVLQGAKLDQTRSRSLIFDHQGKMNGADRVRLGASGETAPSTSGLYLEVLVN